MCQPSDLQCQSLKSRLYQTNPPLEPTALDISGNFLDGKHVLLEFHGSLQIHTIVTVGSVNYQMFVREDLTDVLAGKTKADSVR